MEDFKYLVKISGRKMVPFFNTVGIYFLCKTHAADINFIGSTIIKCAPILCLKAFILLHGNQANKENRSYSRKILYGLLFSCFGDILLNVEFTDLFPHGMIAFGCAQLFYISAFGWHRRRFWIGATLYAGGIAAFVFACDNIKSPIFLIGLPIYTMLLLTMCWRAIDRIGVRLRTVPRRQSKFPIWLAALGSVLFVISDTIIAFDKFYIPLQYKNVPIMATYYAAQFFITLSTVQFNRQEKKTKITQ